MKMISKMKPSNVVFHLLVHLISSLYQLNAFSMNMIPIDSPRLQIVPKHFTSNERAYFLRNISLSRAFHANKKNAKKLSLNSIHADFENIQTNYFVTQLKIGTHDPPFTPFVILDTFSDQTWIQCAKCAPCFTLEDSYLMAESTSYSLMDPDDGRCQPRIIHAGTCGFEASLGKGSTKGYMGKDTFTFPDMTGQPRYFENIAVGCGIQNNDFTFGTERGNVIAGVVGLGPGPKSLITQITEIKSRFLYCIRSDLSDTSIIFGDDAQIKGDDAERVQTIAMKPESRYHLYLAGITVNGHRLPINPTFFELDENEYTKGFFIDPGVTFTVLTNPAYLMLRIEVQKYFSAMYSMEPLASDAYIFDLCYANKLDPEKGQVYPSVILNLLASDKHGGEVDLSLDPDRVFGDFVNENGFCMQILPTPDSGEGPSFFGAYQQAGYEFLFDIQGKLLSFVPKSCTKIYA